MDEPTDDFMDGSYGCMHALLVLLNYILATGS